MEYSLLPVFTILNVVLVVANAALLPELYWKSMLPTTPMPNAITHILHPAGVGKSGLSVEKEGVNIHIVAPEPDPVTFTYTYGATENQLHDDHITTLFLLEKDLHLGTKMNLNFIKTSNAAKFLPRQVADATPFSSENLNDIFNTSSVKPESKEAQIMKKTIEECEDASIEGEEKYCATSLESMVDFATLKLGKNVKVVSTVVEKESTKLQKYTVKSGVKKLTTADKVVVCHKKSYPYAIFKCHKTESTRAYFVPLESDNGARVKAIVVCHSDTSKWNPKHIAFQVLKIKPGTLSVCHFLPEDHIVWVQIERSFSVISVI